MGKLETVRINGVSLAGNALGDPIERSLTVYLPDGYDSKKAYAVVYALASYPSAGYMMLYKKPFTESFEERVDRLIASNVIPPCLVVFPDCMTRYGGSQYINSVLSGNYEDYILRDVIGYVDSHYNTIASSKGRAVMGHSSGGFGAITLAMRNPSVFGSVACHAGDMGFEHCYLPDFAGAMITLQRSGGVQGFLDKFSAKLKKRQDDFNTINTLAMAAAYSPRLEFPGGVELPFDLYTCELKPEVWRRWLDWDPSLVCTNYLANLHQLKIYVDCGVFDEYRLFVGARRFSKRLTEAGIKHVYEEFEDSHGSTSYRYENSLKFFAGTLSS